MVQQDLSAFLCLLLFYLAGAGLIAAASWLAPIFYREGARKAYHLVASGSVFVLLYYFSSWYAALLGMTALLIIAFVVIGLAARTRALSSISVARAPRYEVLRQILYFQATIAVLLVVFWGILGAEYRYLAAAGAIAWGLGDAAAAIIGKRYGRRKLRLWGLDHQKTVAGSSAMFAASTLGILAVLSIFHGGPWGLLVLASLTLGVIATAVEAMSKGGTDTITLPFSVAMAGVGVLALLARLWGIPWP